MFQRVGCYCTGGCLPSNPLSVVLILPSPSSFCVAWAAFFFYSIVPLSLKLYLNQNFMSEYAVKSSYFYVLRLYSDSSSSTMREASYSSSSAGFQRGRLFLLCQLKSQTWECPSSGLVWFLKLSQPHRSHLRWLLCHSLCSLWSTECWPEAATEDKNKANEKWVLRVGTISIRGCFCCFVLTLHFTKKIIYWNLHYIAVKKKNVVNEVQQVAI